MSEDETIIRLSEADWNWLQSLLDRPAQVNPRLAALMKETPPWTD